MNKIRTKKMILDQRDLYFQVMEIYKRRDIPSISEACREVGICERTYYRYANKFGDNVDDIDEIELVKTKPLSNSYRDSRAMEIELVKKKKHSKPLRTITSNTIKTNSRSKSAGYDMFNKLAMEMNKI